jgi:cell division protein FtsB
MINKDLENAWAVQWIRQEKCTKLEEENKKLKEKNLELKTKIAFLEWKLCKYE